MYDWKTFTFGVGNHKTRDDGLCLMEAVAYVAGEPHSDHPACASTVTGCADRVWHSAADLLDRMIRVTEPQEVVPTAAAARRIACTR